MHKSSKKENLTHIKFVVGFEIRSWNLKRACVALHVFISLLQELQSLVKGVRFGVKVYDNPAAEIALMKAQIAEKSITEIDPDSISRYII